MPVTRKQIFQNQDGNQVLRMDSAKRFIEMNSCVDWQFLFNPNSEFSFGPMLYFRRILKIAAEFNKETMDTIRFTSYLYSQRNGAIDNAATCVFNIYKVTTPNWTEEFVAAVSSTMTPNIHFFADVNLTTLPTVDFFGGDTIMVEAVVTRLSDTYRDRIYVNHLGIYDNVTRLRRDVEWLDISKLDE